MTEAEKIYNAVNEALQSEGDSNHQMALTEGEKILISMLGGCRSPRWMAVSLCVLPAQNLARLFSFKLDDEEWNCLEFIKNKLEEARAWAKLFYGED